MNYWKVIEFVNWPKNPADGKEMSAFFKREVLSGMLEFYYEKRTELQIRFEKFSEEKTGNEYMYFGLTDDSHFDLISHIIGLGEIFFNSVLDNPEIAKKMADERNFEEGFPYIFLHWDDEEYDDDITYN